MTKLGKYEILEEIGRGGFAVVYKARDTTLDRVVALKVLHPQLTTDPKFVQRFHQEAQAAAGLHHPHVVTIHEVGEEAGQHYLAMAFLPGRALDERLAATGGPLPVELAVSIVEQIADALDAMHKQGLVHRDVKPANIMVDSQGRATLLDFGIVRAAEGTRLTTSMTVLGTPEYMAPEQAELQESAEVDWRADIYALGVVAYEMLVGRPPFVGKSPTAILHKHVYEPPPAPTTLNSSLPAKLEPVLLKALAKKREDRFLQAGDFAAELRRAVLTDSQIKMRRAQLEPLYEQLQAAAAKEDWPEVLSLGGQIRALDLEYRDVVEMMEQARRGLHRPRPRAKPAPLLVWGAVGAGVLVVTLSVFAVIFGLNLWPAAIVPTETPTGRPTAIVSTETPTGHPTAIPATKIPATGMVYTYKDMVVGFIQLDSEGDWRVANTASFKETAEQLGITLKFYDSQGDPATQVAGFRQFSQDPEVNVIVLTALEMTGWDEMLQEAQEAGKVVVLQDRRIDASEDLYATYVGPDFAEEGRKSAEEMCKLLEGMESKNVWELVGDVGSSAAEDRGQGFREKMGDCGIEITKSQTANWTITGGREVTEAWLKETQNVQGIFAQNDEMGLGAIEALKEAGFTPGVDVKIISVDASADAFEAMLAGELNVTVECNPLLAPQVYEAALKALNGKDLPEWIPAQEDVFSSDMPNLQEIADSREY